MRINFHSVGPGDCRTGSSRSSEPFIRSTKPPSPERLARRGKTTSVIPSVAMHSRDCVDGADSRFKTLASCSATTFAPCIAAMSEMPGRQNDGSVSAAAGKAAMPSNRPTTAGRGNVGSVIGLAARAVGDVFGRQDPVIFAAFTVCVIISSLYTMAAGPSLWHSTATSAQGTGSPSSMTMP